MSAMLKEPHDATKPPPDTSKYECNTGTLVIIEEVHERPEIGLPSILCMGYAEDEYDYRHWLLGIEFTNAIDARLRKREERRRQWTAKDKRNRRRMLRRTNQRRQRGKR